jgi:hypothetical protein
MKRRKFSLEVVVAAIVFRSVQRSGNPADYYSLIYRGTKKALAWE